MAAPGLSSVVAEIATLPAIDSPPEASTGPLPVERAPGAQGQHAVDGQGAR